MPRLSLLLVPDSGADARPRISVRHERSIEVIEAADATPEAVADAVARAGAGHVCVATPAVRLLDHGLERTLDALAEPALGAAADGLIHQSIFVLCEGEPPRSREVHRMTLGQGARAATPASVLGGAMAQPGALVVRRETLAAILGELRDSSGAAEIVRETSRVLGARARLLFMPWILSERLALRSSEVIDLGDALGIDIGYQSTMGEVWKSAWAGAADLSPAQLRLVNALAADSSPGSLVRRVARRLRRAMR